MEEFMVYFNEPYVWVAALFITIGLVIVTVKAMDVKAQVGRESMVGSRAEVLSWKGSKGRVRIYGEIWDAECAHDLKVKKGDDVYIDAVDEMLLKVKGTA